MTLVRDRRAAWERAVREVEKATNQSKHARDVERLRKQIETLQAQADRMGFSDGQTKRRVLSDLSVAKAALKRLTGDDFHRRIEESGRAEIQKLRLKFHEELLQAEATGKKLAADYATLESDAAVQSAIEKLNESAETPVKLGPSDKFAGWRKSLAKHEEALLKGAMSLHEDNDSFSIHVVLNDVCVHPMVVDTGASLISLPHDVAAKAGLKTKNVQTNARVNLADGSIVYAWKMTLASVRVGEFKVENVDCLVLPPSMKNAPLLLGGSFLNNFRYRVDTGARKLVLEKSGKTASEAGK